MGCYILKNELKQFPNCRLFMLTVKMNDFKTQQNIKISMVQIKSVPLAFEHRKNVFSFIRNVLQNPNIKYFQIQFII